MTIPTARPEIPTAAFRDRLERLTALTSERGFEAVLVGVGPDLEYLTGYRAMPLERLPLLVVARAAQPFLVVPRLERAAAQAGTRVDVPIRTWEETEDPYAVALSGLAPSRSRPHRRRRGLSGRQSPDRRRAAPPPMQGASERAPGRHPPLGAHR